MLPLYLLTSCCADLAMLKASSPYLPLTSHLPQPLMCPCLCERPGKMVVHSRGLHGGTEQQPDTQKSVSAASPLLAGGAVDLQSPSRGHHQVPIATTKSAWPPPSPHGHLRVPMACERWLPWGQALSHTAKGVLLGALCRGHQDLAQSFPIGFSQTPCSHSQVGYPNYCF